MTNWSYWIGAFVGMLILSLMSLGIWFEWFGLLSIAWLICLIITIYMKKKDKLSKEKK